MTTDHLQSSIIAFARAQVGKPYDYRGIAGFLARRNYATAKSWFCSELVSAAFATAGAPLLRLEPHKTSPGDLRTSPLLSQFALIFTTPAPKCLAIPGEGLRIGLYSGHSMPSRAIRWRTWSDYSHASLILPDDRIIEALPWWGVTCHADIAKFHKPETPVEIWQPNWDAIAAAWALQPPMPPFGDTQSNPTLQDAPGSIVDSTLTDTRSAAASHFAQGFRRFAQGIRRGMPEREFATP
jgi:hypothetical protein